MSNVTVRRLMSGVVGLALATACGCAKDKPAPPPPPPAKASTPTPTPPAAQAAATVEPSPMQQFRTDLVGANQQIDNVIKSLNALTDPKQADLEAAFTDYQNQLARMNDQADTLKREVTAMRESRNEYFLKWEEKITDIDNPTIRASAEARRQRLRDANEKIMVDASAARDAYAPFQQDCQDVKKYLSSELSKGSVSDIADEVKKVQADGAVVKQKINVIIADLDAVTGATTPAAATP